MPRSLPYLSKSRYLHGLQCPKLLWYEYNQKSQITPPGPVLQHAFDEGKRVGEWARRLFPGGILVQRDWDPQKQHARSMQALEQRKPLFEAGFVHKRAYALADILAPAQGDAWDLIEVKSSTSVKEEHHLDAAFQRYTYEGAGVKIRRVQVMHLNGDYVREGAIDPDKLFLKEDVSRQSAALAPTIEEAVGSLLAVVEQKTAPQVRIGPHCRAPHDCPLQDHCWAFLPQKDSVFTLYSGGKRCFELLEAGVSKLTDIPRGYKLNYRQAIQLGAHRSGKPYLDREAIRDFLERLEYPLHFLDFETIKPAVPVYDHTGPHEAVPFQFSLNLVEKEGARPVHQFYLAPGDIDPRPEVLRQLKEFIRPFGSILAYAAGFEKACIRRASAVYPEYREWAGGLMDRFVDLLEPFQKFSYYDPAQQGSASLKNVLPALTPSGYKGLEIADGGAASAEYFRVTFGDEIGETDKQRVRRALEEYCEMDTRAMIEIVDVLRARAGGA